MLRLFLLLVLLLPLSAVARLAEPQEDWRDVRDLAQIRQSGVLRVALEHSRHVSGEVAGQSVGVELRRLRAFEQYLNSRPGTAPLRLQLRPMSKAAALAALRRGEVDLAVPGTLLAQPAGAQLRASVALEPAEPLLFVARKGNRSYRDLRQLAGRVLVLPHGSAAVPRLQQLQAQMRAEGLEPLEYELLDPSLASEDVLELIHAGLLPFSLVEASLARRWAQVYPRLRVDEHLRLGPPASPRWYVRSGAQSLQVSMNRFLRSHRATPPDTELRRLYRHAYRLQNPLGRVELQRLSRVRSLLQRHATAHELDWYLLAAIAFKESTLNPQARGTGGASGLMQITTATARSMGVNDPWPVENNVLAAARYLARLRQQHFSSPAISARERRAFLLAAYNMGPQRVQSLRAEARRRGLDANRWFFNVERIALEQRGLRGAAYVASVNKYYLVYRREGDFLPR